MIARLLVLLSLPTFVALTGGLPATRAVWGQSCTVPCTDLLHAATVAPWAETWAFVGTHAGTAGHVALGILTALWLVSVMPLTRV